MFIGVLIVMKNASGVKMYVFHNFLLFVLSEVEPVQSSVEDAGGDEAAKVVEAVGDSEDLTGEWFVGL